MLQPCTWPAAASMRAPGVLRPQAQPATVLAAFPTALYLRLESHDEVLPVVGRRGLRLPTAVTLATDAPRIGWGVQPGDRVEVGGGTVRLPLVEVTVVRRWRPAELPFASVSSATLPPEALHALSAQPWLPPLNWREPARLLTRTLLAGESVDRQVAALVGAGPGLTPSGDDLLCGTLLALRLHRPDGELLVRRLWAAVAPRLPGTTSLSASLLTEAAHGYAWDGVLRLLWALLEGPGSEMATAARAVLGLGHTSGADLLGGLLGTLDAAVGPRAG